MPGKRILFLAEGATMAHFVRLLALADSLAGEPYEIHFYAPKRFFSYLQNRPFRTAELPTMPGEQFIANIAKGAPMFPPEVLRDYVKQDREMMSALRPDLVIGDMRLSLGISARLEKIPCAVMINAYWSPYAKRRTILPEIPLTSVIPPRWLGAVYKISEPFTYRIHVGQMNQVRREFGMAPLAPDLRLLYTEGDYVLYADIPEFVPIHQAPANHVYVGICEWTPPMDKPDWWDRMIADPKKKVFISLGSSGPVRILPALLRALSKLPVSVLISTSGRDLPPTDLPAYATKLLPFTETARVSNVVVSHGGSGGLYPAMAAGTPVLGIPSNADQHLSTAILEENGAGLGVRVEEASEERLDDALERLLSDPRYQRSAKDWAAIYGRYDSGAMFRQFLERVFL
jgi:UDP:flavonoid glycosyltransferase YjiC (YdhE family)